MQARDYTYFPMCPQPHQHSGECNQCPHELCPVGDGHKTSIDFNTLFAGAQEAMLCQGSGVVSEKLLVLNCPLLFGGSKSLYNPGSLGSVGLQHLAEQASSQPQSHYVSTARRGQANL